MDPQMLTLFVTKATLLLAAGAVVAVLRRHAPAGDRHLVWLATLVGLLALPALLYVAPLRLSILPQELVPAAPPPSYVAPRTAAPREPVPLATADTTPIAQRTPSVAETGAPLFSVPPLPILLVGLWLGGAVLLTAWLAAGALAVRRVLRTARPLDDPRWRKILCEVADRLDMAELPRLVASDRVEVPFACGISRPTVVLPAEAEEWPDERRGLVLVHELAHVRRRDLVAHTVGRLACALYWFHPLVWAAARRLRAESERACDDLVLTCGARASDYAGLLLDVVSNARHHGAPATAVPMARRRELEGRVLAILDPQLRRGQPGRVQSGALLGGLAVLLVFVAAVAPSLPAQTPDAHGTPPPAASTSSEPPDPPASPERASSPRSPRNRNDAARPPQRVEGDRRALLAQLLHSDPDASVRRSAAWALSETGRGEDGGALVTALRGDADAEVREMAAWALSDVHGSEAAAALAEALRSDTSPEVRATAAWALGQTENAQTDALLGAAADRASEVKQAAIWALGQQKLSKAPAPVTAALRDGDAEVRLVAAWALGEISDPASEPAVRSAFAAEKNDDVRRALFRTLALLGGPTSDLIDQALASGDPELRQHAVMLAAGKGRGVWPWPWPWPQPRPNP